MSNTEENHGAEDDFSGLSEAERQQLLAMGDEEEGFSQEQLQSIIDDEEEDDTSSPPDTNDETPQTTPLENNAPGQEDEVTPQAPVPAETAFKVDVQDGAAERLIAIEQEQQELATALQDGDIDMGEFVAKNNALNKESLKLNIAIEQANFAQQQNENMRAARWKWTEEQFMSNPANQIYSNNPIALDALNAAIRRVSSDPANAGKPDDWYLKEADKAVRLAFNVQAVPSKPAH